LQLSQHYYLFQAAEKDEWENTQHKLFEIKMLGSFESNSEFGGVYLYIEASFSFFDFKLNQMLFGLVSNLKKLFVFFVGFRKLNTFVFGLVWV
jgi:hypothetical protein